MDHAAAAVKSLSQAIDIFRRDLEALPEEAYAKSLGGKARTVADIVCEVNMVNDHIGMVVRGEKPFDWPEGGWITAPEDFREKAVVMEAFAASSDRLIGTFTAFDQATMDAPLVTEEGETTRTERARFLALHLWYHSGQLNFIQTLLGDDAWHW